MWIVIQPCRRHWLKSAVLIGCVVAVQAVSGYAAARSALLAPLGALGIEPAEARRVQGWLAAAARKLPGFRWIPTRRAARRLRDARYYDCAARPECIGQLARRLGASIVVTGDVGSIGGSYVAYLRAFRANGEQLHSVNGVIDPRKGTRLQARALLYQLLIPKRYTGTLIVTADVDDAWVYLDGRRVARGRAAQISQVPVGTHAVRVTHEAYRDFVQFVPVEFERQVNIKVGLSAYPVHAKEMRLRDSAEPLTSAELPWYRRWWAVATFGAIVFAAAATTVAMIPRSVERDDEAVVVPP